MQKTGIQHSSPWWRGQSGTGEIIFALENQQLHSASWYLKHKTGCANLSSTTSQQSSQWADHQPVGKHQTATLTKLTSMVLYLQQKTAQAWEWLFAIQRAKSCSLSRKKPHFPLQLSKWSTGSKEGFEASTRDQVSADNLRRGLTDAYLSTSKQYSLSVKLWTHNEGHSVSCLMFFKNKLLSCA